MKPHFHSSRDWQGICSESAQLLQTWGALAALRRAFRVPPTSSAPLHRLFSHRDFFFPQRFHFSTEISFFHRDFIFSTEISLFHRFLFFTEISFFNEISFFPRDFIFPQRFLFSTEICFFHRDFFFSPIFFFFKNTNVYEINNQF